MIRCQSLHSVSQAGAPGETTPALLTSTSIRPHSSITLSAIRATDPGSDTSTWTAVAPNRSAAASAAARSRSATHTTAPSAASRSTVARPMPDAPPVTMATLLSKRLRGLSMVSFPGRVGRTGGNVTDV